MVLGCSTLGTAHAANANDNTVCVAKGTTAAMANAYFGSQHDNYQGADYQRSFALHAGRVLWTRSYTYLYGYCYRQFGFSLVGADPCESGVKVGRVDKGHLEQPPTYWDGSGWQNDPTKASTVFGAIDSGHNVNPPQVRFTGTRFTMISQADDWFSTPSTTTNVYSTDSAQGPWALTRQWPTPLRCEPTRCNTYFASWLADGSGWGISPNVWSGSQGALYLPTFDVSTQSIGRAGAH